MPTPGLAVAVALWPRQWQILGAKVDTTGVTKNVLLWITLEKNQMQKLDAEVDKPLKIKKKRAKDPRTCKECQCT